MQQLNRHFLLARILLYATSAAMLISLLAMLVFRLKTGYDKDSWNLTEWLINFEGGFVRRGLPGQLLLSGFRLSGVNVYRMIVAFCLVCYVVLCAILFRAFRKKSLIPAVLPAAFLLGGPVFNDFWLRKDVFMVLCFFVCMRTLKWNNRASFWIVNLLSIIAILSHESYGFWGLTSLVILFATKEEADFSKSQLAGSLLKSLAFFLPAILVFLACIASSGNQVIAESIWNSWKPVPFPFPSTGSESAPAAIGALGWTLDYAVSFPLSLFAKTSHFIYVPFGLGVSLLLVYLFISYLPGISAVLSGRQPTSPEVIFDQEVISLWLKIEFITFIPLSVLGWDYSRWFFIWTCVSLLVSIYTPREQQERLLAITRLIKQGNIMNRIRQVKNSLLSSLIRSGYGIFFLFLIMGVAAFGWGLRSFVITTPPGIILNGLLILIKGKMIV